MRGWLSLASFFACFLLVTPLQAKEILPAGHSLTVGQKLVSANGLYEAVLQNDGNFVLYSSYGRPLWASKTAGKGVTELAMQSDGTWCRTRAANRFGRQRQSGMTAKPS